MYVLKFEIIEEYCYRKFEGSIYFNRKIVFCQ